MYIYVQQHPLKMAACVALCSRYSFGRWTCMHVHIHTCIFMCVCVPVCVCLAAGTAPCSKYSFRLSFFCLFCVHDILSNTCTYIHVYMCVCVCMWKPTPHPVLDTPPHLLLTTTQFDLCIHIHMYIYTCIYIFLCSCVCDTPPYATPCCSCSFIYYHLLHCA